MLQWNCFIQEPAIFKNLKQDHIFLHGVKSVQFLNPSLGLIFF